MYPEKHLKDLKSSDRKSRIFDNVFVAILFLISFVFFGPIIHELGHIAMLEFKGCNYLFNIGFMFPHGIHAEVSPLCAIKPGYIVLFYSIGYLLTLSIGVGLNLIGSIQRNKKYSSDLIAIGTGMLLSVILTIGVEGDIQNALEVMNLDPSYSSWISLLIIFGVFAGSIQGIQHLLGLERQE